MKRLSHLAAALILLGLMVAPALADTLILKTGARVSGFFEGGTARVVKFRGADNVVKDYDILSVEEIQFGDAGPAVTTRSTTPTNPQATAEPRLRPATERPPANPVNPNAANTGYTIPTGSKLVVRMVDSVNSETQTLGSTFIAILDEPLVVNGVEVAPRGSDIRGRISNINEAGRIAGKAELGLELTQLYVNGIPYALTTSEYAEAGENRAGQTARRAGLGAAAGAVIGAIAGGGKGAAIGAGVGAGAGTAVQVMTKGEKLNIPAETRLEFTLRSPLVIAGNR